MRELNAAKARGELKAQQPPRDKFPEEFKKALERSSQRTTSGSKPSQDKPGSK